MGALVLGKATAVLLIALNLSDAEWVNALLLLVSTIVLTVTMVFVYWYARQAQIQAQQTTRMAKEIEENNRRSLRPILDFRLLDWPPSPQSGELDDFVRIEVRNVGTGPAVNISVEQPGDDELGFEAGAVALTSLAPGTMGGETVALIRDGVVTIRYQDIVGRTYTSARPALVVQGNDGYATSLGELILSLPA